MSRRVTNLIYKLAEQGNHRIPKTLAHTINKAIFADIIQGAQKEGRVTIPQFGSFIKSERAARTVNFGEGKVYQAPAHTALRFKSSPKARAAMNGEETE